MTLTSWSWWCWKIHIFKHKWIWSLQAPWKMVWKEKKEKFSWFKLMINGKSSRNIILCQLGLQSKWAAQNKRRGEWAKKKNTIFIPLNGQAIYLFLTSHLIVIPALIIRFESFVWDGKSCKKLAFAHCFFLLCTQGEERASNMILIHQFDSNCIYTHIWRMMNNPNWVYGLGLRGKQMRIKVDEEGKWSLSHKIGEEA